MSTLHSNNPVPSNGSVATVICGVKSISMTLSGVGAIRAVVQIMSHEDGAAPGPIGSQIVVSGTTTVTTTQTFNAEAGKVYLQLIDITPACKFSATLTELGPIQDTNPGSPGSPFTTTAERDAWAAANLSTLKSGVSTVWGPGAVEYVWKGPLATDWQGIRGPFLGSPTSPFASTAEIVAAGVGATETPWVLNPLAPLGRTQAYFADGVWAPIPGQCIALYRSAAGQPLVDMTATGRAPATWYEVWAPTDPLPDWLVPNFRDIGLRVRVEQKETTNTGTSKLRATLRAAPSVADGETDAIMGGSFTGSEFGRGLYAGIVYAQRSGSLLIGSSGTGSFTVSVGTNREVGTFAAGATKPRLDAQFGLATNTLKLFSVSIWAGA